MFFIKVIFSTFFCLHVHVVESLNVNFKAASTVYLPYKYTPTPQFGLDEDAAEQLAFDPAGNIIYSVGHTNIHVIDISDIYNPKVLLHKSYEDVDCTDVEVCGEHVFVAFDNQTVREDGFVDVYNVYNKTTASLNLVNHIVVGDIPDMIHPTKDCRKLVVAIEAEPYIDTDNNKLVDNPGGIGVITFTDSHFEEYSYKVNDFGKFDTRFADLEKTGVRWVYRENNNTFANDIEPEYVTINSDESKAYISLQENNAIAIFDMKTEQIEEIRGLGFKNWNNFSLDVSDIDGGIHMKEWPVYGMYQPDTIKHYTHHGVDYLIMSNEGDSKDYEPYFEESVRVHDIELSPVFERNTTVRLLMQENSRLGRLYVSSVSGKNPDTGKYDKLFTFGGRGFSIRRADSMELVYDSGNEIAHKTALLHPRLFNSDYSEGETIAGSFDSKSDDMGPETESLTMGHFGDTTLLLIGNERPGTIAVYTIDERIPEIAPTFVTLLTGINTFDDTWENLYQRREISMLDPEDMKIIQSDDSPNGKPLLLVSGSTSGTVTIIEIDIDRSQNTTEPNRTISLFVNLSTLFLVFMNTIYIYVQRSDQYI